MSGFARKRTLKFNNVRDLVWSKEVRSRLGLTSFVLTIKNNSRLTSKQPKIMSDQSPKVRVRHAKTMVVLNILRLIVEHLRRS